MRKKRRKHTTLWRNSSSTKSACVRAPLARRPLVSRSLPPLFPGVCWLTRDPSSELGRQGQARLPWVGCAAGLGASETPFVAGTRRCRRPPSAGTWAFVRSSSVWRQIYPQSLTADKRVNEVNNKCRGAGSRNAKESRQLRGVS